MSEAPGIAGASGRETDDVLSGLASRGLAGREGVACIDGTSALRYDALAELVREESTRFERGALAFARGGCDVAVVVRALAALEAGVPLALYHPRWPEALVTARTEALRDAYAPKSLAESGDEAAAFVLHSSGTTAEPRALALPRRAVAHAAVVASAALSLGSSSRWLLTMPLAHVGGLSAVARVFASGGALVFPPPTLDAAALHDGLERHAVTHVSLVPTLLARLVRFGARAPRALTHVVVGGAACDDALARAGLALGYPVLRTYGMTETFAMATLERFSLEGGVGRPLPGVHVNVSDGELRVKSAGLFVGEVRCDATGAPAPSPFDDAGFFRTRDAGSVDAAGCVHVHGRLDDVLVTGGENVHPAEVEAALAAVSDVREAVVFGVPDAEWGTRLVAVVATEATPAELTERLRGRLPSHAVPRTWVVRASLESTPSGKVDRRAAIATARATLAAGQG